MKCMYIFFHFVMLRHVHTIIMRSIWRSLYPPTLAAQTLKQIIVNSHYLLIAACVKEQMLTLPSSDSLEIILSSCVKEALH